MTNRVIESRIFGSYENVKGKGQNMRRISTLPAILILGTGLLWGASPNLSVKVGGIISETQILIGSRSMGGRIVLPTVGLGYFSLSTKSKSDGDKSDLAVRLFLPRVGVRLVTAQVENLRAYFALEGFLLFPLITGSETDRVKENIKDGLDLLGLTIGYGAEYFFSSQFSLGGELSMNWVRWDEDFQSEFDDFSSETRVILGATLTRVTLNFYFK